MYAVKFEQQRPTWWTGKTWSAFEFRRLETERRDDCLPELMRARRSVDSPFRPSIKIVRTDV